MPWFKSEEWERVLTACDEWQAQALYHVEDPGLRRTYGDFGRLTREIRQFCNEHTHIDAEPLWTLYCQASAQWKPNACHGPRVPQETMEATMRRCLHILDSLWEMGGTDDQPTKTSADSADTPKLFPKGLPDDQNVIDLVLLLNDSGNSKKSQNTIAREFTNGTELNPESLLRKVRRLRDSGDISL